MWSSRRKKKSQATHFSLLAGNLLRSWVSYTQPGAKRAADKLCDEIASNAWEKTHITKMWTKQTEERREHASHNVSYINPRRSSAHSFPFFFPFLSRIFFFLQWYGDWLTSIWVGDTCRPRLGRGNSDRSDLLHALRSLSFARSPPPPLVWVWKLWWIVAITLLISTQKLPLAAANALTLPRQLETKESTFP